VSGRLFYCCCATYPCSQAFNGAGFSSSFSVDEYDRHKLGGGKSLVTFRRVNTREKGLYIMHKRDFQTTHFFVTMITAAEEAVVVMVIKSVVFT